MPVYGLLVRDLLTCQVVCITCQGIAHLARKRDILAI
jgi:hypothetical protein